MPDPTDPASQPPVDYLAPAANPHPVAHAFGTAASLIGGFTVGVILTLFLGYGGAMVAQDKGEFQFHSVPIATLFFVITLAGLAATIWGLARPPRHFFLAGLATGAALASLIEGSCFLNG